MFVQIIEGQTADREGLRRQADRWRTELRPGATGYLGATEGITRDGHSVTIVRFDSEAAARANSERPEQGQWWAETEKYYDGDVTFHDSSQVETLLAGGSNDAGFVQIMKGHADRARLRTMDDKLAQHAASFRPDLIGGIRIWTEGDAYIEAAYFTSEAEARANESNEPPAELEDLGFREMMANVEFLDIHEPHLF